MRDFNKRVELRMIEAGKPPGFKSKFVVATDAGVHDVISAVKSSSLNHHDSVDQILDVSRARPDIVDSAHSFAQFEIVVHRTQKTVFAGAIDPRRSDDVAAAAGVMHRLFADQFGFAIEIDRRWLIVDRVRHATDGFDGEYVLRAEMNNFRATLFCRFGQMPRTYDSERDPQYRGRRG